MAILTKSIFNQLKGRIGDLIFYESYGKTCIRTRPDSYRDRKSEKQILHRKRISSLAKLYHIFRPALRFDIQTKHASQSSYFYKLNWNNISVSLDSVEIDYSKLIFTNQFHANLINLEIKQIERKVHFQWTEDHVLDESFFVLCAVFCKDIQHVYVSVVKRNSLSAEVNLPINYRNILTYTYTFRRKISA